MIILPQEPLHHLLLPLLLNQPVVILLQKTLKVFCSLLPVDGVAHLLCYLRREVIPDGYLLQPIAYPAYTPPSKSAQTAAAAFPKVQSTAIVFAVEWFPRAVFLLPQDKSPAHPVPMPIQGRSSNQHP